MNMRLTEYEQKVIKETAQKHFGNEVSVYIFRSRVNDALFGGDIDIYLENISSLNAEEILNKKLKMLVDLDKTLGEQKIDIVINKGNQSTSIIKSALATGIRI